MAVKIRLKKMGTKKRPFYRFVAADVRSPRDGRFIETLGYYNPLTDPPEIKFDEDKVYKWLGNGAKPTANAASLMRKAGLLERWRLLKAGVAISELDAKIEELREKQPSPKPKTEKKKVSRKKAAAATPEEEEGSAGVPGGGAAGKAEADAEVTPRESEAREAPEEAEAPEEQKESKEKEAPKDSAAEETPEETGKEKAEKRTAAEEAEEESVTEDADAEAEPEEGDKDKS